MQQKPWYKHPWFWMAMTPALGGVFSGILLVFIAVRGADEVIRADYVKVGMEPLEDNSRREAAKRLGLSANIHLLRADGRIIVTVRGLPEEQPELLLRMVHPTDGSRDQEVALVPSAGVYRADLGRATSGRWTLQLEPTVGSWRLDGELTADASAVALGVES
jgi:hypothetical protein